MSQKIFIKICEFPHHFRSARIALIKIHSKDSQLQLTLEDWKTLADKTEGYSGSDIANMTLGALFGPIRDLRVACYWCRNSGMPIDLLLLRGVEIRKFCTCLNVCTRLVKIHRTHMPKFYLQKIGKRFIKNKFFVCTNLPICKF